MFSITSSSFSIISFLIVLGNSLFLAFITIFSTLENIDSKEVEVAKIAK